MFNLMLITLVITFWSCDKNIPDPADELSGLHIEISGLRNNDGIILLELIDENENTLRSLRAAIENKKSTVVISDIEYGNYAFKYFHDENENGELDTSLMIPTEGYGFSNNATGTFGPPKMEDMLFEYAEPTKKECEIMYLF